MPIRPSYLSSQSTGWAYHTRRRQRLADRAAEIISAVVVAILLALPMFIDFFER